ncbi:MAG TPA: S8 family serine peptidase [Kribbella sp.]|nr:S8 family serine peptidase [Kribbella sp.]
MSRPLPSKRFRRRSTAVALVGLLVTAMTGSAGAAPPGDRPASGHSGGAAASLGSSKPVRITLITGDTVTYSRDRSGRASATVAPGPGRGELVFDVRADKTGYYVVPSDVAEHVRSGLFDRELFDVQYLAANGYGDGASRQIPLIVQYRRGTTAAAAAAKAKALPGRARSFALASIHGAAVGIDKARAGGFWKAVGGSAATVQTPPTTGRAAPAPRLGAELAKVWLDAKATASDDLSNAQIGAPIAWAAGLDGRGVNVGIIDTGIDATHPDLTGKVVAARNFVAAGEPGGGNPDDATDRHGHGTHVASIVTGSGAASDGRYKGVAGGARLIIAKALSDVGSGANSGIIAAMEWQAATQRARIVSMSLGGGPTDGTDPMSQAVNDLSERYGTLFVIAAGNAGPGAGTVAAPGAASAALTVGAVDGADRMAVFSSRGPRLGSDYAIKPEITAPGVRIVAARAAGTLLGSDLGPYYTGASGTSMATPHVAAAAATLLQQHADWTNQQLKNALIGSAKDGGFSPYDQGSGRLDLGRAVTQQVFAETSTISAAFTYPYTGQTLKRQVTYRNFGASPVTLAVAPSLTNGGNPAPEGMVSVDAPSVTVPAGGAASVELTVDPTLGEPGTHTGQLVATSDGGDRIAVPMAFRKSAKMLPLRVRVVAGGNFRHFGLTEVSALMVNDDNPLLRSEPAITNASNWHETDEPDTYEAVVMLPEGGVFHVETSATSFDPSGDGQFHQALMVDPQVTMDYEQTLTFRADELVPLRVRTPRPSQLVTSNYAWQRTTATGIWYLSATIVSYPPSVYDTVYLSPTEKPTVGSFWYYVDHIRIAPQVSGSLSGAGHLDLHPRYVRDHNSVPKFSGDRQLAVVGEADLRAGRDVRGKLVLSDPIPFLGVNHPIRQKFWSLLDLAAQAGAAGVLTDSGYSWRIPSDWDEEVVRVPLLWVTSAEATRARQMLAEPAALRADLHGEPTASYEYKLANYLDRLTPQTLTIEPDEKALTQIDTTYHAQYSTAQPWGPAPDVAEVNHTFAADQFFSIKASHSFPGRVRRLEYFTTTGPDVIWSRDYGFYDFASGGIRIAGTTRAFSEPSVEQEDWNEGMLPVQHRPGPGVRSAIYGDMPCDGCRQGDTLRVRSLPTLGLGQYSVMSDSTIRVQGDSVTERTRLWRGDTELEPRHDQLGLPYYELPAEEATYTVTNTSTDGFAAPHTATKVDTTWTFRSGRVTEDTVDAPHSCIDTLVSGDDRPCAWLPLIYLNYDLGLPADDMVPAGRPYTFTIRPESGQGAVTPAGARVWVSPDRGEHWTEAAVTPGPDRTFQVVVANPAKAQSSGGTVSLKTRAWDAAGNSIEQIITDAYLLR